jgi:dGTP triphosphohydrolase
VLLGLFAAYHNDPRLLEDHVLFRYREIAGGRYLRDLPRTEVDAEIARRYRKDPRFARVLADYLAGMTDVYAITEHSRLRDIGAVPVPGVEQLRREEETT